MSDLTAIFALSVALVLALLAAVSMWRSAEASKRLIRDLQQRIARLERERISRPAPRVSFEFKASTREALLHIANDGGDAEMWAMVSIEGALAQQLTGDVCAAWAGGNGPRAVIRRGESGTLRLAQLDLSVFPYAQWQIYGVGTGLDAREQAPEVFSMRAMHTSMIGGDPETHAPTMFLQIAVATDPESIGPPPHCTIALQPFEAIRLRPV